LVYLLEFKLTVWGQINLVVLEVSEFDGNEQAIFALCPLDLRE
jgi:hypothetical protein